MRMGRGYARFLNNIFWGAALVVVVVGLGPSAWGGDLFSSRKKVHPAPNPTPAKIKEAQVILVGPRTLEPTAQPGPIRIQPQLGQQTICVPFGPKNAEVAHIDGSVKPIKNGPNYTSEDILGIVKSGSYDQAVENARSYLNHRARIELYLGKDDSSLEYRTECLHPLYRKLDEDGESLITGKARSMHTDYHRDTSLDQLKLSLIDQGVLARKLGEWTLVKTLNIWTLLSESQGATPLAFLDPSSKYRHGSKKVEVFLRSGGKEYTIPSGFIVPQDHLKPGSFIPLVYNPRMKRFDSVIFDPMHTPHGPLIDEHMRGERESIELRCFIFTKEKSN